MALNDYHFITRWRVRGSVAEVMAIIGDANSLSRWWPSVYLEAKELEPGDALGVGKVVSLYTKGWLPYTLRWSFRVTEVEPLRRIVLVPEGDFSGRGIWSFVQEGEWALISYDWKVRAEKPLLRALSPLFKPILAANHHWAMRMGERSLALELQRRRARTPAEAAALPSPPGPTTSSPWPLTLAALGALGVGAWLGARLRQRTTGNRQG